MCKVTETKGLVCKRWSGASKMNMSNSEKGNIITEMVQCKNYGHLVAFNGGIYYVKCASKKLKKLSDYYEVSENKFQYFCKNSNATKYKIIQGALIVNNKLNKLWLKNYIICQKGVAQVLFKVKTPLR